MPERYTLTVNSSLNTTTTTCTKLDLEVVLRIQDVVQRRFLGCFKKLGTLRAGQERRQMERRLKKTRIGPAILKSSSL
jgi:hypothetical protein